jgi:hypothetical protein
MDTATKTETHCEAVDKIVTWDQVQAGDLVLWEGRLELVIDVNLDGLVDGLAGILLDGRDAHQWVQRTGQTAVARYIETTEG